MHVSDYGGQTVADSNCMGKTEVPTGANFLYESGRVTWWKFDLGNYKNTIDVGSRDTGWVVFYRPAGLTTGPFTRAASSTSGRAKCNFLSVQRGNARSAGFNPGLNFPKPNQPGLYSPT